LALFFVLHLDRNPTHDAAGANLGGVLFLLDVVSDEWREEY
jgi:hypothetical protein